ncbi:MAG: tRNA lysidine(34) synthetase TilS [Rhodobacteraceae bacterium]|nr:tRNA lysidine(34) synthetase TilS [Paracoccaceae bacterium]
MPVTPWPGTGEPDADLLQVTGEAFRMARSEAAASLPVGVAVSGGGDSMALLHLLHRVAPQAGFVLHAVTVDHGLRPESAAEAAAVAAFCASLGVAHDTLRWGGPDATGNLMDQARRARMRLMADWARSRGIGHIALGHTADDQAESFLINLSRAAGLDGLAGMRAAWTQDGVCWTRPLLGQTRDALRAYLRRNGVEWAEDPSNDNDRFTRVRARRALKALRPLGITVERLTTVIHNLSMAQEAVTAATVQAAGAIVEKSGTLHLPRDALTLQSPEIRRRLLIGMIRWMNGSDYPPREAQVRHLEQALHDNRDATLGGVRFRVQATAISISREPCAVMGPVPLGQVWDHRWHVAGPGDGTVRAVGADGLRQVPEWRKSGLSRDAALVCPAVWQGETLLAAPLLASCQNYTATLTASFTLFLISH